MIVFYTAAAQQCVWQWSSGTRSLLHLPACTGRRSHPRTSPIGCVSNRCFSGAVRCGFPPCLLQTQVRLLVVAVGILKMILVSAAMFVLFVGLMCIFIHCCKALCNISPRFCVWFRLQMLDHFAECIKQAKGVRQQAVQLNIFTAVLSALKVRKVVLWSTQGSNILCHYWGNTYHEKCILSSLLIEGFGWKQEYSGSWGGT